VLFQDSPDSSIMLSMTPYTPSPLTPAGLSSDQIENIREKVRDEITLRGRELCWYCDHNVHHETQTDDCECQCHTSGDGLLRAA